jgi:stage III sporulation protein AG
VKKFFEKIKKVKHWEIYLAAAAVIVILVIYFSTLTGGGKTASEADNTVTVQAGESYADRLERKLLSVIGGIKGAGAVSVIVVTNGEGVTELAYDIEEKVVTQTGSGGASTETKTTNKTPLRDKNGSPIILYTNPPEITGVLVVAAGAFDPAVKLAIVRAVQAVVGDANAKIEILTGK